MSFTGRQTFPSDCYVAAFFLLTPMFVSAQSIFRLGFFSPVIYACPPDIKKPPKREVFLSSSAYYASAFLFGREIRNNT